ncbi:MAG TPA: RNA polymerase sigma-70 factor [Chryseosolibacter sp.]
MENNNHLDSTLVNRLIQGDNLAFSIIYKRYAPELYNFARKNISSTADCEEIIQDIFESLWLRRESLSHVTLLRAYLYKMVRYKIIRYFQHSMVKARYAEHFLKFEANFQAPNEADELFEMRSLLDKGLAQLPERCREAVHLRINENLNNNEIAKRMNISKATVENYFVSAIKHLKSLNAKHLRLE